MNTIEEKRLNIITQLCYTARPDFEYLSRPTGEACHVRRPYDERMTQTGLWQSMQKIFDNEILPHMNFKENEL